MVLLGAYFLVYPLTQWLEQLVRTWKAVSSSPGAVFGCCLWSTSYWIFRDACAGWFNSGYMFYGRLWTNFTFFHGAVNSNPEAFGLHTF